MPNFKENTSSAMKVMDPQAANRRDTGGGAKGPFQMKYKNYQRWKQKMKCKICNQINPVNNIVDNEIVAQYVRFTDKVPYMSKYTPLCQDCLIEYQQDLERRYNEVWYATVKI